MYLAVFTGARAQTIDGIDLYIIGPSKVYSDIIDTEEKLEKIKNIMIRVKNKAFYERKGLKLLLDPLFFLFILYTPFVIFGLRNGGPWI